MTHLINIYHFDINASHDCNGLNKLVRRETPPTARATVKYTTPIEYAAKASNLSAIKMLLDYGAEIRGCLGIAIGNESTLIIKMLLGKGADASKGLGSTIIRD